MHGAIGVTADHDLQLFTRRLHEWRIHAGSEAWWHEALGRSLDLDMTAPGVAGHRAAFSGSPAMAWFLLASFAAVLTAATVAVLGRRFRTPFRVPS